MPFELLKVIKLGLFEFLEASDCTIPRLLASRNSNSPTLSTLSNSNGTWLKILKWSLKICEIIWVEFFFIFNGERCCLIRIAYRVDTKFCCYSFYSPYWKASNPFLTTIGVLVAAHCSLNVWMVHYTETYERWLYRLLWLWSWKIIHTYHIIDVSY